MNSFSGSVTIALPGDATYTPGVKQRLTVRVADSAQKRWGFELSARLDSDKTSGQAGTLTSTDTQTQVLCDVTGRKVPCSSANIVQFITHTTAGTRLGTTGGVTFSFDWTPPATDSGPVTLYAAGNAANGDGSSSGDHIYTTSIQLTPASAPASPTLGAVVSAASLASGTAPASWIVLNGTNLSSTSRTWTAAEATAGLPTSLDSVSVQVNGKAAYVQSISPTKLIVLTPSDSSTGPVNVQVSNHGMEAAAASVSMAALAPSLLVASGGRYMVTSHGDNPLADRVDNFPSAAFPAPTAAAAGEVISFYGTGFGPVDPVAVDGVLQGSAANLTTSYTLTVGGKTADVSFAGLAPGFAGIYQFKAAIPVDSASGDQPVVIQIGGLSTQQSDTCCFVQVAPPQQPVITSTVSAASLVAGSAPASWLAINGTNLANSTRSWTAAEASATSGLPTMLDGVSVQINGNAAFIQSVSPAKVLVLAPSDSTTGSVNVQLTNNSVTGDATSVTAAPLAPALFTADGKYLVTTHGDKSLADRVDNFPSAAWPIPTAAAPGETIAFYGTGFGVTDPVITDGILQKDPANLTTAFTLTIGGNQVTPAFAGLAPGFAGVFQFKANVPSGLADGDQSVVIQINGQNTVQSDTCCFLQVKTPGSADSELLSRRQNRLR